MEGQAQVTTTAPVATKPGAPAKLTDAEAQTRYAFIGMCVDRNITYPATRAYGQQDNMTVQDLCAANIEKLQKIAQSLKEAASKHDPEFSNSAALMVSKVKAEEWLTFFRYTIRKKIWDEYAKEQRKKVKALKGQIEAALTPEEKRKQAEAELVALGTEFAGEED